MNDVIKVRYTGPGMAIVGGEAVFSGETVTAPAYLVSEAEKTHPGAFVRIDAEPAKPSVPAETLQALENLTIPGLAESTPIDDSDAAQTNDEVSDEREPKQPGRTPTKGGSGAKRRS